MDVFLEIGHKRIFAGVLDWPGWCRGGKDEEAALQALLAYAERYQRAILSSGVAFTSPADVTAFGIVERLKGGAGTDFGAPGVPPAADAALLDEAGLERGTKLLQAIWASFDTALLSAAGKELATGPRGGGRQPEQIELHVLEAEMAYLGRLGGDARPAASQPNPRQGLVVLRQLILDTLGPAARGELPARGPRGGKRWTARFYLRYAAWHLLDHTWEIEDRII